MMAKGFSCKPLSLQAVVLPTVFMAISLLVSPAKAEVYRCQNDQGKAVFTDNKFACPQGEAKSLTIKTQTVKTERKLLASIPDLSQQSPNADFPDNGRKYCAPVAVSNSLSSAMGGLAESRQIELAQTLGSAHFMNTDNDGTSSHQVLSGVDRFLGAKTQFRSAVLDKSDFITQLEYRGQDYVARKYNPNLAQSADMPWLVDGIRQEKHIWLNIGWYQKQGNGRFKRVGGHWVTLVGYEKLGSLTDGKGEFLFINDPATDRGAKREQIQVALGKLNGRSGYQLLNPGSQPSRADTAWIEGAIQLTL